MAPCLVIVQVGIHQGGDDKLAFIWHQKGEKIAVKICV